MKIKFILLILVGFIVCGCPAGSREFVVRFRQTDGLRQNDSIIFKGDKIGYVTQVKYTDQADYSVSVSIENEFESAVTEYSKFYIDSDPLDAGRKILQVVQIKPGGKLIPENAILAGDTKFSVLYHNLGESFRESLKLVESELSEFFQVLQGLPDSEQIKQLEKELDRILAEIEHLSASARAKVESEILPRIKEQLENLRKRLKAMDRENEMDRVDQKIQKISAKLKT